MRRRGPLAGRRTYTMDAREAAEAANAIKPQVAVPMHWGNVMGVGADSVSVIGSRGCLAHQSLCHPARHRGSVYQPPMTFLASARIWTTSG